MVKLASSPYGIWLYSYIKHSNSEARRIKRVRGQRLRLDLADRHLPMGFGQLPHRVRCADGPGLLAPRWATRTPAVQPVPSTTA
jgi:hypothetical protein